MVRLLRFAVGSLIATLASAAVFPLVYQVAGAGPQVASLAAFATGAAVSFVVNRSWTWNRRERDGLWRDIAAFLAVAGAIAVLAAIATSVAESYANRIGVDGGERTLLVESAYLGTYAIMFLVKFLLLDRWVFRTRDQPAPQA
jgi:putative flippase GtrA